MVPDWVIDPGAISPVLLQPSDIVQFFVNNMLDYDMMIKVLRLYPMLHPVITDLNAGCHHAFVKLAIVQDFLL
jgi:hypothetical protein